MILYVGDPQYSEVNRRLKVRHLCAEAGQRNRLVLPDAFPDAEVLLDSGAFPDVKRGRVTREQALERQFEFERRCSFIASRIASYDVLIDEQLIGDVQKKKRWSVEKGWSAVEETVVSARFLADLRNDLRPRQLILSIQGVDAVQYVECAERILSFADPVDCIGLGGWCILGQRRELIPSFWDSMNATLPKIAAAGLKDVHLFGVGHMPVLVRFADLCRSLGLRPSTDTVRFYTELSRGGRFDPETGMRIDSEPSGNKIDDAVANIEAAYEYIGRLPFVAVQGQPVLIGADL